MSKIISKWMCCECDEVHEFEDDAYECCRPRVKEVHLCPVCDEVHTDYNDAVLCCKDEWVDGMPPEPRVSAIDLEQAGQMRLLP